MKTFFLRAKWLVHLASILMISLIFMGKGMANSQANSLVSLAEQGNLQSVKSLVEQGVDIEQRDSRQRTALMGATHENHLEVARFLIEQGADVNARDNMQDSPYLYAGARGLQEILVLTLQHGADLKSTNRYGGTALIPAAERGHVATVKTLIDAGVDVNHVNRLGWTALIEAIILGDGSDKYAQIVTELIKGGADVNLADGSGISPLTLAKSKGYRNLIEILERSGAK
ncbi:MULTISPECIES: ankyrin repeat domain-containing protein [Providencia]|uniref:Ankyrin repeat domain-containing protein n=1 Tax=Providencia huaxiensis TaxID=2027290 RepID=A0ABU2IUP7_9GAMM|nr:MULTISPECIES: ankyrin repeat domain-containing protein [Providencia]MBZ3683233.1 ankyrin repeat domain-containing protein [Providencia rettgeri]AXH62617.1 ankyrin repeat domain-containing protein [Providencia huaxiensis]MDT0132532.1 ankyrin repeat domain-containing protein [Providencia huaxiensis]MDT1978938.1 ankyrin repeat domain-containing protein [Providencia huaxiensis]QLR02049.1 ankyrin repeat domain-containing protein [Providencia rettgeri]